MAELSIKMPDFRNLPQRQKPPVELLRDAARILAQQTGGVVEGRVFTTNPGEANMFRHTFYLHVNLPKSYYPAPFSGNPAVSDTGSVSMEQVCALLCGAQQPGCQVGVGL